MSTRTTKIEWTDKTWNPITGCTKQSAGCAHCYAETMSRRLKAMGLKKYSNGFGVTLHPEDLNTPRKWRQGHNIFVCSMSDLFHKDVPFEFIDKVMATIEATPQHRYQLLTKRAERMAELFGVTQQDISYHLQQINDSGELHLSDGYKKYLYGSEKWSDEAMSDFDRELKSLFEDCK